MYSEIAEWWDNLEQSKKDDFLCRLFEVLQDNPCEFADALDSFITIGNRERSGVFWIAMRDAVVEVYNSYAESEDMTTEHEVNDQKTRIREFY